MSNGRLPVFQRFIADLRAIWAAEGEDARRMERAKPLLESFVKDADLKAHSAQWPSTEGRKNLLLYVDPDYAFVVNGVVRVPGRTGSVHDHAGAWVLYGVLDGTESLQRYKRIDDGSRTGQAERTRSLAVVVRSQRLGEGTVLQHRYDTKANTVIEQYGPTQIPYDLVV